MEKSAEKIASRCAEERYEVSTARQPPRAPIVVRLYLMTCVVAMVIMAFGELFDLDLNTNRVFLVGTAFVVLNLCLLVVALILGVLWAIWEW